MNESVPPNPPNELSIVYLLTNPAMPGLVKIGRTSKPDANKRIAQLYSVGVPVPFNLEFACKVPNSEEVEAALHMAFAPNRINQSREFFRINPEQAIAIMKLLNEEEDVTEEISQQPANIDPQEIQAGKRLRGPLFNFQEMNIPVGSTLQFEKDQAIEVTVVGPRKVKFLDEESFLAGVTKKLLGTNRPIRPILYWRFHGRLLLDIYNETYGDSFGALE